MVIRGRLRAIYDEALQLIMDFLEDFPTAYQDEIYNLLEDKYGIVVNPTTMGRYL